MLIIEREREIVKRERSSNITKYKQTLVEALQNGVIAGVGLDVFVNEPLSLDHPLRSLENVVLSLHTASMVPEATLAGLEMAVDNVINFLQGHATNVVKYIP